MGCFSWCYCDTGKIRKSRGEYRPRRDQRLVSYSHRHPASVLFPKEFGGKDAQINEYEYGGYGVFNGQDIYELAADWNRRKMAETGGFVNHEGNKLSDQFWFPFYADLSLTREQVAEKVAGYLDSLENTDGLFYTRGTEVLKKDGRYPCLCWEYRYIGIFLACYDEDNERLPYPIKIAKYRDSVYEECPPSMGDPKQGCD